MVDKIKRKLKIFFVGNNIFTITKIWYFLKFNRKIELINPKLFSDKIQYLKLFIYPYDKNIGHLSDKVGVRDHLDTLNLKQLKTPIIGIYDSVKEIQWDSLPESFVAKKSNAAGYNIIVKDKSLISKRKFFEQMTFFLHSDYGKQTGEKHYSLGLNKIIIEPFLDIGADYKFFCFNGNVSFCSVITRKYSEAKMVTGRGEFERSWIILERNNILEENLFPKYNDKLPDIFDKMVEQARVLSLNYPFVRVDFYEVNDKLLLSELTFTPSNGFNSYFNIFVQKELGNMINLESYLNADY